MAANHHSLTQVVPELAPRVVPGACCCARSECAAGRPARERDRPRFPVFAAVLVFLVPVVAALTVAWSLAHSPAGQGAAGAAISVLVLGLPAVFGRSRPSGAQQSTASLSGKGRGTDACRSRQ